MGNAAGKQHVCFINFVATTGTIQKPLRREKSVISFKNYVKTHGMGLSIAKYFISKRQSCSNTIYCQCTFSKDLKN